MTDEPEVARLRICMSLPRISYVPGTAIGTHSVRPEPGRGTAFAMTATTKDSWARVTFLRRVLRQPRFLATLAWTAPRRSRLAMKTTEVSTTVAAVVGTAVPGAVDSGPTSIAGLSVVAKSNAPDFQVVGDRYSILQKVLPPGASFQGEPGVLSYMSSGVTMKAQFSGFRMFSGEGLAKLKFTNEGQEEGYIGLSPNMPMAIVIPYDPKLNGPLNCKRGAFMAGDMTVKVMPKLLPAASGLACCCGGMAPIIQEVSGSGMALLAAGGTIVTKTLAAGEQILVDSDSVVAFTPGMNYDVKQVGTFVTCCCGGEGCFNTQLTGPGTVYLQSMSYEKLLSTLVTGGGGGEGGDGGGGGGGAPPTSEGMAR